MAKRNFYMVGFFLMVISGLVSADEITHCDDGSNCAEVQYVPVIGDLRYATIRDVKIESEVNKDGEKRYSIILNCFIGNQGLRLISSSIKPIEPNAIVLFVLAETGSAMAPAVFDLKINYDHDSKEAIKVAILEGELAKPTMRFVGEF